MTKLQLSATWLLRLEQCSTLFVGYSGGLDSTVLLHLLSLQTSLRGKLVAVHINHGISPNALAWQQHCEQFCLHAGIPYVARSVDFDRSANVEEQARDARYAVFSSLLTANDGLLLGHHQDDQAETVLLQLFRGAGIDGLAAMQDIGQIGPGVLLRPLLSCSRNELHNYADQHQLHWINDESNGDIKYSRNYLRQHILPLLAKRWPGIAGNLSRTAAHCAHAKTNLEALALIDCNDLNLTEPCLPLHSFENFSEARLVNILRLWLRKNQIQQPSADIMQRIVHEVCYASPGAMPIVSWNDMQIRRYQQALYLDRNRVIALPKSISWEHFPLPLDVAAGYMRITAKNTTPGLSIPDNADISVAFRQGGERLVWHGQTKELKKLFQEWGVAPWLRNRIPLVYINGELAVIVGYAISDLFFSATSSSAWSLDCSFTA